MPPKIRFQKKDIIRAAVEVVREEGAAALNARSIASKLGCSTQPLYRELRNMEEIKDEVFAAAQVYYQDYVTHNTIVSISPYKSAGLAFLRFANDEKELFKLLFMRKRPDGQQGMESDPIYPYVIDQITKTTSLTYEQARTFHRHMSIYSHGLAVMIATNYLVFNEAELSDALSVQFHAIRLYIADESQKENV